LNEDFDYMTEDGTVYSGSVLVKIGFEVNVRGDFGSVQVYLRKKT
jgi:hypothetical protein